MEKWFANRGQVIQVIAAILGGLLATAGLITLAVNHYIVVGAILAAAAWGWTIFSIIWFFKHRHLIAQARESAEPQAEERAGEPEVVESLGKIRFDYLPATPLEKGWTRAYKPDGLVVFGTDQDISDSLRMDVTHSEFAMDYVVPVHMTLANRLMFTAKYDNSPDMGKQTMIFAFVEVSTRDRNHPKRVWLKFYYGGKKAYQTPGYIVSDDEKQLVEHTVHWPATPRDGLLDFGIDLREAVKLALGTRGWIYNGVFRIRLRGNLSISPIKFAD